MLSAAPAALAQTPMVPDTPPPPPPPPAMPVTAAALKAPAPKGVAAIVNGKKIFRFQVATEAMKTVGPQILNQMILIELINQEAVKKGVVVTPADVAAKLADVKAQYAQRVPGGLDTFLAQRHQSLASYKDYLTTELKVEALVAKTLPASASGLKYHARHLVILTTAAGPQMAPGAKPPHTDAEALAIIAKAEADLKAGKTFEEVANTYTEDPSGKGKGGDLGIVDAKTQFDPAFLQAVLKLKAGEVTAEPVKSSFGYHLIKVDDTSAAPLPADKKMFDDALAADRRQEIQQAIPTYVQTLRSQAKVIDYLSDAAPSAPAMRPMRMPTLRPGTGMVMPPPAPPARPATP